ncbi:MAG: hypothetical protein HYW48_06025 [Deltaproteobacteria bacterium]|nr:hypothetical protein [Deltaproteobacteria bacterium]
MRVYIALECDNVEDRIVHALTTHVMRWSDKIWLLDLTPFYSYWAARARALHTTPQILWKKTLHQGFAPGDSHPGDEKVLGMNFPFRASCAPSPWQALLLLLSMRERRVSGLLSLEQELGQTLYTDLPWSIWWHALSQFAPHLASEKDRRQLAQGCERLKRTVERLNFRNVQAMKILSYDGIRRRFGLWLAECWQWTFDGEEQDLMQLFSSFPWKAFRFSEPASVTRHLEDPLCLWETISPFLIADLDKLGRDESFSAQERVVKLEWKITFDDLSILTVPICFRHPHDLHGEEGKHKTTLLQAVYGFQNLTAQAWKDLAAPYPSLLSWQILLKEKLVIPAFVEGLFDHDAHLDPLSQLLKLENELPIPLERFAYAEDWFPEESFVERSEDEPAKVSSSFHAVARARPLFLYQHTVELTEVRGGEFLESILNKWWRSDNAQLEKRYYKYVDPVGRSYWVCQDETGRWLAHGNFG